MLWDVRGLGALRDAESGSGGPGGKGAPPEGREEESEEEEEADFYMFCEEPSLGPQVEEGGAGGRRRGGK